jgi:hypothetical protein
VVESPLELLEFQKDNQFRMKLKHKARAKLQRTKLQWVQRTKLPQAIPEAIVEALEEVA